MKEYLHEIGNNEYVYAKWQAGGNTCIEIPEGAECLTTLKDGDRLIFWRDGFKKCVGKDYYWISTDFTENDYIENHADKGAVIAWKRQNTKEYLDPSTWTLHTVDVDNDAAGEDWLLVPEGADFATGNGSAVLFRKDNFYYCDDENVKPYWRNTDITLRKAISSTQLSVCWQRHTQPEELPFIDDEPIDNVNHPSHYTQGDIECIDAIKASMSHEAYCGYLKGNVQKYMWRYEHKGGVESLKKAQWYLDKLVVERSQ